MYFCILYLAMTSGGALQNFNHLNHLFESS